MACSGNRDEATESIDSQAYLKDSLILKIDDKSRYDFNYFEIGRIDGREKLVVLNQINSSIDFYNLQDGNIEDRFDVSQDGPTPVRNIQGMHFYNQDSIFVFTSFLLSKFGLFDKNGKVRSLHRPIIESDNPRDKVINQASNPTMPTVFSNGKLFFSQLTLGNPAGNPKFSESHYPEFIYYLEKDSAVQVQHLKMPADFLGSTMPLSFSFHSKALNNSNEFVISWFASDSLYVFDMDFNLKSVYLGKSGLSKGFEKTTYPLSQEESDRLTISQTHYPRLIYDSYRRLYYRFAYIGRPYDPNELIDYKSTQKNPFSIIVLDEEFSKLEEVIFPGSVYNLYHAFVAESGLYLPMTNIFYVNLNEDEVKYEIFDFSSL
ncbi:DUF4221 family protein [Algoriphagus sp.]|uniref:DUF4221 family protein n=1 Tax=Algoriphagus sp. TaxID=1872435 RepID=UPI00261D1C90|nr:DUF4221 family protein [Algoriphagus sp.]